MDTTGVSHFGLAIYMKKGRFLQAKTRIMETQILKKKKKKACMTNEVATMEGLNCFEEFLSLLSSHLNAVKKKELGCR